MMAESSPSADATIDIPVRVHCVTCTMLQIVLLAARVLAAYPLSSVVGLEEAVCVVAK